MLTVGDKFPRVQAARRVVSLEKGKEFAGDLVRGQPGQVEGRVLLAEGLHLRLPDRDRRVRQAATRTSPIATPRCSGSATTTNTCTWPGASTHPDLKDIPYPMLADVKQELTGAAGRHPQAGRRAAAGDLHRRPARHHPPRQRQRPRRSAAAWTRCCACSTASRPTSCAPATGRRARRRWRRPDHDRARATSARRCPRRPRTSS